MSKTAPLQAVEFQEERTIKYLANVCKSPRYVKNA